MRTYIDLLGNVAGLKWLRTGIRVIRGISAGHSFIEDLATRNGLTGTKLQR